MLTKWRQDVSVCATASSEVWCNLAPRRPGRSRLAQDDMRRKRRLSFSDPRCNNDGLPHSIDLSTNNDHQTARRLGMELTPQGSVVPRLGQIWICISDTSTGLLLCCPIVAVLALLRRPCHAPFDAAFASSARSYDVEQIGPSQWLLTTAFYLALTGKDAALRA